MNDEEKNSLSRHTEGKNAHTFSSTHCVQCTWQSVVLNINVRAIRIFKLIFSHIKRKS